MNGFANIVLLMLFVSGVAGGSDQAVIESVHATEDVPLHLDPASEFWGASRPVYMEKDKFGKVIPRYRTEIRTRWTKSNLYFLFVCPYEELYLKPAPNTQKETNELWNWDVAEVFVGSDFTNIKRYKEFEISPQGEWVDLDIDLGKPHHEDGWTWNSGLDSAYAFKTSSAPSKNPRSASRPRSTGRLFDCRFQNCPKNGARNWRNH